jgi:hypothetical protein
MKFISRRSYPLLSLCVYAALASAAPPSNSPYYNDAQTSNVQDATSKSIGQVNMITCIMHAMRPDALVNQPSYNALVDEAKCDQEKRSTTSTVTAPSYMTSTVSATRTSNTDPMRSKIWIDMDQGGGQQVTIFVNLAATAAPTATNPYGTFRLDFCGKGIGQNSCMMNGYMDGSDTGLRYYETEQGGNGSQTTALQLNTTSTTTGSGQVASTGGDGAGAYTFAYNSSLFLRGDGTTPQCFSRDATDPDTGFSVWRYGLYDATTGDRVVRNSGFPIEYTSAGTTYQGYLGYGGLSLPSDVMNLINSGDTVQKVDYSSGNSPTKTDYTVVKAAGKLTKYTRNTRTLLDIDKVRFNTFLGMNASTFFTGAQANTQYEMYWDDTAGVFKVTGLMNCSNNGCQTQGISPEIAVDVSKWSTMGGVQGWSQSLGGEMYISLTGVSGSVNSSSITVVYRTQDLVYPAQMAAIPALYCVRDCPTASSLAAYFAQGSQLQWPFESATANNWQPTALGNVVTYQLDSTTALLNDAANQAVTFTDANAYNQHPQYQNGIRSGRLFPTLAAAECSNGSGTYCDAKVNDLDVYYQWETGANSYSQFAAVKDSSGTFVHFDAPLLVNFTVPNGAAYGQYAGTSLVLQYGGYGDLWGVPGYCVSPDTNAVVQCGNGTRYVPSFQIPFDTVNGVAMGTGNTTYYIKWLDREIRFANKDPSVCSAASLTLPSNITLPTAGNLKDPGDVNSDIYIGVRPTVTDAPRVIHGDVKY